MKFLLLFLLLNFSSFAGSPWDSSFIPGITATFTVGSIAADGELARQMIEELFENARYHPETANVEILRRLKESEKTYLRARNQLEYTIKEINALKQNSSYSLDDYKRLEKEYRVKQAQFKSDRKQFWRLVKYLYQQQKIPVSAEFMRLKLIRNGIRGAGLLSATLLLGWIVTHTETYEQLVDDKYALEIDSDLMDDI